MPQMQKKLDTVCLITLEVEKKHNGWLFEKVMGLYTEIVCLLSKTKEKEICKLV